MIRWSRKCVEGLRGGNGWLKKEESERWNVRLRNGYEKMHKSKTLPRMNLDIQNSFIKNKFFENLLNDKIKIMKKNYKKTDIK